MHLQFTAVEQAGNAEKRDGQVFDIVILVSLEFPFHAPATYQAGQWQGVVTEGFNLYKTVFGNLVGLLIIPV